MSLPPFLPTSVLVGRQGPQGEQGETGPSGGPFPDLSGVGAGLVPQTTEGEGVEFIDLSATIDARVVQLGPSNGTDDTATIQAALTACRTGGGGIVRGMPGEWYTTTGRLVIGSNTEIDIQVELGAVSQNILNNYAHLNPVRSITDAAITASDTTLTSATAAFTSADVGRSVSIEGAGSTQSGIVPSTGPIWLSARIAAVTNSTTVELDTAASTTVSGADASIYDRDQNITVRGRWISHNPGALDTNVHHMLLNRVDGLTVHLDQFVADDAGSKYAIYLADYTGLDLDVRGLDAVSDGVHLQGPAMGTNIIRNVEGTSGDDLVAIGTGDNTGTGVGRQNFSGGSMEIEVQSVRSTGVGTDVALKLYGMPDHTMKAKIGKVSGADAGVFLGAADVQGFTITEATVDQVDTDTSRAVAIYANAGIIKLNRVKTTYANPAGVCKCVDVTAGFTVGELHVTEASMPNGAATAAGGSMIDVAGTVTDLFFSNSKYPLPSSGSGLNLTGASAAVTRAHLSNLSHIASGGSVVRASTAGQTLGTVWLRDVYSTGAAFLVDMATTTILHLANVEHAAATTGSINCRATSVVTVLGHGASKVTGVVTTTAGYALRINCPDFSADISKVTTASVGDRFMNTNTGVVPFVSGPVLRDVSAFWISGAGYAKTGTATLVGGTVTVADTKIRTGSVILVSTLSPGGTVGTPYVSARTASTSFTITSTSGTDTSVVAYQIVTY